MLSYLLIIHVNVDLKGLFILEKNVKDYFIINNTKYI